MLRMILTNAAQMTFFGVASTLAGTGASEALAHTHNFFTKGSVSGSSGSSGSSVNATSRASLQHCELGVVDNLYTLYKGN